MCKQVKELLIEHIREETLPTGSICIHFDIYNFSYTFYVHHRDVIDQGTFFLGTKVYHNVAKKKKCPFCKKRYTDSCTFLSKHSSTLFERLIKSNAIRLNWLFREYTEQ